MKRLSTVMLMLAAAALVGLVGSAAVAKLARQAPPPDWETKPSKYDPPSAPVKFLGDGKPDPAGQPPFTFVFLGGVGHGPGSSRDAPGPDAEEVFGWIAKAGADFTVVGGDVAGSSRKWEAMAAALKPGSSLLVPVPGNHDLEKGGATQWEKMFGPLYYSFTHKGCQFIVMCSEVPDEPGFIGIKQLNWLKEQLNAPARVRFVFCHRPFWREGSAGTRDIWMNRVHPLLKDHNVAAVFAAHHIAFEVIEQDGVRYITTQGAGQDDDDPAAAKPASTDPASTSKAPAKKAAPKPGAFTHYIKIAVPADGKPVITVVGKDKELAPDAVNKVAMPAWPAPGAASAAGKAAPAAATPTPTP